MTKNLACRMAPEVVTRKQYGPKGKCFKNDSRDLMVDNQYLFQWIYGLLV